MKISSFKLLNRKRVVVISVVLLMMLQVVMIPTVVGPSNIEANYDTAEELDTFFQSVNQRNDEVNETVIEELNFLRSLHEGSELAVSLLDTRKSAMNSKDESGDVIADLSDYETVTYDYSERGLKANEVNDPEPTIAEIISTMQNDADLYQDSFLGTALSIFTETYLIYWAYDANGNGNIDVGGCGDGPPEEPCEEGVVEANLVSTLWGASTALIAAWVESLDLDNFVADFILLAVNAFDEGDAAWVPIDVDQDGNDEIRARLVPVINDLINEDTDANPLDGDVGLEANLGLSFEFEELEELNQTLDIAIVRGITYNDEDNADQTYVWGVNTQFPPNEVPDEYSLSVVIEEFVFTIGTDGSGGIGLNPGDVDYVNAPYQINILMNNETGNPLNNGIDNLEIAIGYLKYNWSSGTTINPGDALEEITFIKLDLDNPRGKVPRELGVRLVSQTTDGIERDSIEVYAPASETTNPNELDKKFNLGFQYYEYNLNPKDDLDAFLSHIKADITGVPVCKVDESGEEICLDELNMPEASLWLEIRNESTSERNWTVIEFHSTEPIESIVYGDYEYYTEDGRGATWLDHDYQLFTGLEISGLPESLVLEGNLQLDESGGSSIPVNDDLTNIDSSLVGGLISDLLIGLAGRIVYVGDLLRSIPKAVLQSTIGEGDGEVTIRLRNRINEPAYIDEIFVYLTSDKYLALNDGSGDDYFAIYNESAYLDNNAPNSRSSISPNNEDYSFSAKITDIGDIDFYSREGITNISLSMDPIRDKPFRVYFEGIDEIGETSHWANITLSNIPTNITLNIDNGNLIYAGGNSANEIIDNIIFTSLASGIYSRFKLEHLPGSAEIVSSGGDLRLITDSWFNFTFTITNVTENEKATSWIWDHSIYNGSSVMLYQNNMGLENETASLSGNLSWIQALRLDDDGSGELANFKINHRQPVQFKVGAIDDTEYEEDYKGLDAYVFIDSLPSEIIVTVPILDSGSIIGSDVGEVNDLRDVARFIEALSQIGKALVDSVADLSINLVTNVESFETVARFLYNINEEVSITAWVNKGNIELLDESPRWVEGLWSSQKDVEGGTILGARLLLKGLPQSVDANYTSKGDHINLELNLEDYNYRDTADYIIFQEEGIIGPKVTAFIEEIPVGLDLNLNADLVLNATVENITLSGSISMNTSQPVGPIYLVIEQNEEVNPYRVEAFISSLPGSMIINMEIHEELLEFNISSDQGIDTVVLEIDLGDSTELETYWTEGISLDMSDDGAMNMKAYLRGISPNLGLKLWDPEDEGTQLDISLEDFNHDVPSMDRILVDINNFENKSVLLRIDDLPNNFDLNASVYLDDNGMGGNSLVGNITLESSKELGSIYALVSDEKSQSQLEIAVPNVPEKINLDVVIGDQIGVDYSSSSAPSRVILSLKSGNLTGMDLEWTHGIVLRQNDFGDALLLYLEGTVTSAKLSTTFGEPDVINLDLGDWSPITKWIYLDLDRGPNETAIELFLDEVGDNNNINAFFQTGTSEGRDLDAIFDIHHTGGIGSSYLKTHNQTRPSYNEIYFSKIPKDLRADLIVGKEIDIIYEAEGTLDYIWVKTANKDYGQWKSAQAIVHDVPESFHMGIDPNYEFDMDLAFAFQGFPNLFVSTSSSEIDILLMVDEGYTGGHSGTFMEVENVGDNTSMVLDGINYIIDSPNGIDSAYLKATNSPATPQFYLDYMVIHAKNIKHVEIIPNQIFGLYPVFELANAEGGELSFAIGGDLNIGPIKLETSAVLMDLRIREVGGHNILPTWLGIQKNGMDTELGNNEKHYIVPEPGMSFIASLEASI
tara:strand:- start:7504 stop:12927 length:5424 start_codon:yes stop_codon:yes gene_type:complete